MSKCSSRIPYKLNEEVISWKKAKKRVRASRSIESLVKALLLPILDIFTRLWVPASSFYSSVGLVRRLTWGLYWVQDFGAIIKRKDQEQRYNSSKQAS